jgi:hypothetical protein
MAAFLSAESATYATRQTSELETLYTSTPSPPPETFSPGKRTPLLQIISSKAARLNMMLSRTPPPVYRVEKIVLFTRVLDFDMLCDVGEIYNSLWA